MRKKCDTGSAGKKSKTLSWTVWAEQFGMWSVNNVHSQKGKCLSVHRLNGIYIHVKSLQMFSLSVSMQAARANEYNDVEIGGNQRVI